MNFTGSNVEKEIPYLDLGKDLINGSKAEITVCKNSGVTVYDLKSKNFACI